MERIQNGIGIQVIWWDQDVIQYRFTCSNGCFSGKMEFYADYDDLPNLAANLMKFPRDRADFRDFELGTFDTNCAGGGARMHFYCRDSVGHAAVDIQLRTSGCRSLGEIESVALRVPIEAAGVDSFILQIKRLEREIGTAAHLAMAK